MGNAQNRERHRSGDVSGSASPVGRSPSPFMFDQRRRHSSGGHESPLAFPPGGRRSGTVSPHPGYHPPLMHQRSVPVGVPHVRPEAEAEGEGEPPGPRRLPVVIQWRQAGHHVELCGSFTGWQPVAMARSESNTDSEHMAIVNLPEGRHEYRFRVDGHWRVDEGEPTVSVGGEKCNFITVAGADFTACDALNMEAVPSEGQLSGSPPGVYSQERPELAATQKPWLPAAQQQPPALPPHLLEVMLNKEVSASLEPTLLPAPNHVMLNHLYALSIKDGVMVLSATHRYRKKYVTTLLYKPI